MAYCGSMPGCHGLGYVATHDQAGRRLGKGNGGARGSRGKSVGGGAAGVGECGCNTISLL
jgi:hypothetical protein